MLVERAFQTGLRYVAVSRVKTLQGWMLDAPFDRSEEHTSELQSHS